MSSQKVLLGAVAGLATGALLGIFLAPQKGSELRKKISDSSRDYANDLKDKFSTFVDSLNEKFENAKGQAGNLGDQGMSALDQSKKDTKGSGAGQKAGMSTSGVGNY